MNGKETWYVRDASGNVMSVYTKDASINTGDVTQSEVHLYGSSRLGIYNFGIDVEHPVPNPSGIITFSRGKKFFELSNHLGNACRAGVQRRWVLATISDKKIGHSTDGTTIDYYDADVISANDYYPFGMLMPERKYAVANTNYRFGFNGKELDKEVSGTTTYDYGFRIYNPGLGRFLSVDPLTKSYPELTPYQFASNTPIQAIDLDGAESMFGWSIGLTPEQTAETANTWNKENAKIGYGTACGVKRSVEKTWSFVSSNAWKAKTWGNMWNAFSNLSDITIGNFEGKNDQQAYNTIQPNVANFKEKVVNGDGFTRSEYLAEIGTDLLLAKGINKAFTVTKGMVLAERMAARLNFAKAFYESVGGNVRDVAGINFARQVTPVSLNSNTKLYQWTIDGRLGDYFSPAKEVKNLGLPQMPDGTPAYFDRATNTLKPRTLVEVNLPNGTNLTGLKSTAADIKPWDGASGTNRGGHIQIYSPQVKTANPTVTTIE